MSVEFEVFLEGGAPWGFRLHGGKEFRAPLRVAKVETDKKAASAGLLVGDQVLEINGKNVENLYHTEALVAVKKATDILHLHMKRENTSADMIQVKSFVPVSTVPMKPASATSVPVDQIPWIEEPIHRSSDEYYPDDRANEWSPDLINDLVRTPAPISISRDADYSVRSTDSNESGLDTQYDPNMSRTASLPRSLGKKSKENSGHKSMTLPRKSSQQTPAWYKEMYKEIHKTMEGQSHLSRLLTADAAKGAFRDYDGATSPRTVRKQRPKSVHVDKFNFEEYNPQGLSTMQSDADRADKREKRHSVHSSLYRDFQKGGQLPAAGLSAGSKEEEVRPSSTGSFNATHTRSRSQDDMLSSNGLPYQRFERNKPHDPVKFEYNNPPDFLDLRRKAEAEGTLREERDRELKMLQEERRKWLDEEEELRKKNVKQHVTKDSAEAQRQMQFQAEEQRRKMEEDRRRQEMQRQEMQRQEMHRQEMQRQEMQRQEVQREEERRRAYEYQRFKEDERLRQKEAEITNQMEKISFQGRARGLYAFQPQSPTEIGFKKDDVIDVIKQIDDNWYEGELNGNVGIFPVAYVELIEDEPEPEPESPQADDAQFPAIQIEEGLARARYTFKAENEKELSFKKNEMVTLLRQLDDNWYEGEVEDRIGIFPVAYVEILKHPRIIDENSKFEVVKPGIVEGRDSRQDANEQKPAKITNGISMNHTSIPKTNDQVPPSAAPVNLAHVQQTPAPVTAIKGMEGERHRAVFSYSSTSEDELDVKEGDIVYVLEKCDDGWFVGTSERSGRFGTFPGNYVVPV